MSLPVVSPTMEVFTSVDTLSSTSTPPQLLSSPSAADRGDARTEDVAGTFVLDAHGAASQDDIPQRSATTFTALHLLRCPLAEFLACRARPMSGHPIGVTCLDGHALYHSYHLRNAHLYDDFAHLAERILDQQIHRALRETTSLTMIQARAVGECSRVMLPFFREAGRLAIVRRLRHLQDGQSPQLLRTALLHAFDVEERP